MILSQGTLPLCLLLAFIFVAKLSLSAPDAYCVKPASKDEVESCSCDKKYSCKECQPLRWYAKNSALLHSLSNSILYFLPGSHELPNITVSFLNLSNFTMVGAEHSCSQISCTVGEGGLLFSNSTNVNMTDIVVAHCVATTTYKRDSFTVVAAVSFRSSSNVTLSQVTITNSSGLGLHMDRMSGYVRVLNSNFLYSTSKGPIRHKYSANARFYYGSDSIEGSSLHIEHSSFMYGYSNRSNYDKPDSSGLLILIYAPSIQVTIKNITAKNNTAQKGANVGIVVTYFHESTSNISIDGGTISNGKAKKGGGLICYMKLNHNNSNSCQIKKNTRVTVSVRKVHFENNTATSGGAVYIRQQQLNHIDCTLQRITFSDCVFKNNKGIRGIAVAIIKFLVPSIWPHNAVQFDVTFKNCNFSKNNYSKKNSKASVIMLLQADSVNVISSNFINNDGTAISLVNSNLLFKGSILFKNNSAAHGGALNLCDSSIIYLSPHTHVKFLKNHAKVSGGAIFAEQRRLDSYPPCFYQPLVNRSLNESELKKQVQFEYINNSAGIAGHAIYGGSVDYCFTIKKFDFFHSENLFTVLHNLANQSGSSVVTSDPVTVLLCDPKTKNVSKKQNKTLRMFPGEQFPLSVSAVGQRNGSVPAYISVSPSVGSVQPKFSKIRSHDLCHTVNLTVSSNISNVTLNFLLEDVSPASSDGTTFKQISPQVTVIIKDCPWIFELDNETQSCDCAHILLEKPYTIQCSISNQSFNRGQKNVWIGCHYNKNSLQNNKSACDQIMLTKNCPEEFCSANVNWLTFENAYNQCQKGRDGILCGRCKEGSSLTLGPSECVPDEECPPWRVPILLLVFIVAGIVLVLFLAVFNFTVTQGTMYGLLFYANVVHANQKLILNSNSSSFWGIFIAWLNLDFGFKVCFYSGMDAYQKMWLEFAFVLYILSLAVLIIYLSHKFIFVTRLVGRNVVNVLSTVLLLSLIKTARTGIKALNYIDLDSSDSTISVWYYDGNIGYLQGKHIPLALVSIFLITVVSIYTFSLLFIQCLQRGSSWCVLRWVNRLRPFFDANTGPCRDNYRFWPGFLLFGLLVIFALHVPIHIDPKQELYIALAFCVFIFVLACISPRGVYKKWPLNVLEFSFFLNLGSLCGIMSIVKLAWLPSVSIGIAVFTFILILAFHGYQRVSGTRISRRVAASIRRRGKPFTYPSINATREREDEYSNIPNQEVDERTPFLKIPLIVHFNDLRESLLASDD